MRIKLAVSVTTEIHYWRQEIMHCVTTQQAVMKIKNIFCVFGIHCGQEHYFYKLQFRSRIIL